MKAFRHVGAVRIVVAVLCAVLMMVATTAEAGHSCEAPLARHDGRTDIRSVASGAGPCLLCLGAHSPSLAAPISAGIPDLLTSAVTLAVLPVAHHSVAAFALYIRPPPAL